MGASWPSWRSWEGGVRMFSELVARNSRRSRRENGLFFTSLLISIVAFYIILSLSHQDVMVFLQRMESSAVDRLLSLVPVLYGLTLFILFFLVYYANRFQLARRRHEFGVYLMLGMQRRKLFGMLLAEDLRSSLIALAIGLPAALLISEVISLVTARLVGLGIVGHRFTLSLSAIGWTAVGFLAIKLLASLILSGKIVREEIGALLTETPEGTKKQRPAVVYAAALVLGAALLAGAYTFAILGYAWSGLRYMAGTIALGVAGTLLLFYGLRVIIDRLARRGDRAGRLRVFNFRQVEETVIHRSGALAICSLLILAALCCFGAGVATARSSRAETHTLDYTFPTDSEDSSAVRDTLAAHGLDGAFSDLFEMRIGRVRTSTDYQNTVKFPALQRTIDAMPVSDEQQQLQYMLEAVGYPYLIALSSYNRLLTTAGLPELTLADNEAAVYCDSEVSLASRTALINRLIAEGSSITIDGAPFTLCGQVQSVSVVTDRSITMSFALIVPDAVFDHYTQGDYDVYLDGVLAPSMTEGKSLMNAIADMNALLDPLGLKYESYLQNLGRELFYIVAASYLTIYLAIIFLVVANTIIGVQFLIGQQKAARRYRTLVRLGAEHDTLCRAAKAQINWYFGLPVGVAAVSSVFGVRALFSSACSVKSCSASRSASTPSPVRTDVRRIGLSSKNVPLTRLLTSSSSMFSQSSSTKSVFVSTMSPSFTPSSCRMSRCSTVCGMKPSSAATTSIARSTPPAPASMFLMNLSCPGTSTMLAQLPSGKSRRAKPRSIVMPRFFSSASRSVSTPVSALTSSVLPWST